MALGQAGYGYYATTQLQLLYSPCCDVAILWHWVYLHTGYIYTLSKYIYTLSKYSLAGWP